MNRKVLCAISLITLLTAACSRQAPQNEPVKSQQPANKFDIKFASLERAKQWQAPEGGSVNFTKGMSMKMVNGAVSGFEAEPGYEFAVVKLSVNRMIDGASQSVDEVSAIDDKGKEYSSIVGQQPPLGKEKTESREFAFAVPAGTQLKKIQLAKDLSLDLK